MNAHDAQLAAKHLAKYDTTLAPIIATNGLCPIRSHTNYYQELVESIISQQLSIKAAATILKRFRALFGAGFPQPEAILQTSVEKLRTAGLSRAKATYIRDLAGHVADGKITFGHFDRLRDEQITAELVEVKGIGEWTAHMFLMFCMGRPNVLAVGDLGIRTGMQQLYGLPGLPTPQQVRDIARTNHWEPYQTVACWYIWQSVDAPPVVT